MNQRIARGGAPNVVALLTHVPTGRRDFIYGHNVVTNDGDAWYAYKAGGSSYFTVAGLRLGSAGTAPAKTDIDVGSAVASGSKAIDAGYPKVSDDDADNAAYASIDSNTWRVSFGTAEGNGTGIYEGALVDSLTTPTKAVSHFVFGASFTKTTSDTLGQAA